MTPSTVGADHLRDHRGDVIVDGAGHWVQQQAPDAVNAALLDFLDGLDLHRS
jgi:pimeloyl-ACP methyl ester carboxylesterase